MTYSPNHITLHFTPEAIRDHFTDSPRAAELAELTDEQLRVAGAHIVNMRPEIFDDVVDMMYADALTNAADVPRRGVCRYCERDVTLVDGAWLDLEATGDDSVWRATCDKHDTFEAEHDVA